MEVQERLKRDLKNEWTVEEGMKKQEKTGGDEGKESMMARMGER